MTLQSRTIRQLSIGEDTLAIRFKGTTNLVTARILDRRLDDQGRVVYLCLDRLIHRPSEGDFKLDLPLASAHATYYGALVSGCFATEMRFQAI